MMVRPSTTHLQAYFVAPGARTFSVVSFKRPSAPIMIAIYMVSCKSLPRTLSVDLLRLLKTCTGRFFTWAPLPTPRHGQHYSPHNPRPFDFHRLPEQYSRSLVQQYRGPQSGDIKPKKCPSRAIPTMEICPILEQPGDVPHPKSTRLRISFIFYCSQSSAALRASNAPCKSRSKLHCLRNDSHHFVRSHHQYLSHFVASYCGRRSLGRSGYI
ncbi:hypothetical protein C8J57DRAFT_1465724 [Mycena rebaudengoi]|nr:hypothetical protein C8J57DRAFT_1470356 [Mycena rebaudengoi]KAJ7277882.1 hypothetical protein C8J57DRAFT_1465724 [Mycena rebaudengoi]